MCQKGGGSFPFSAVLLIFSKNGFEITLKTWLILRKLAAGASHCLYKEEDKSLLCKTMKLGLEGDRPLVSKLKKALIVKSIIFNISSRL